MKPKMKNIFTILFGFCCLMGSSQSVVLKILEKGTGEPVPFSSIYCESNNQYIGETDDSGIVFVNACSNIVITNLSYRDTSLLLTSVNRGQLITIYVEAQNTLEIIEITDTRPIKVRELVYNIQKLKNLQALLGERDIIKSLTLTPGVQTTIEGASTISVRGGSGDQNLILLDGAKLYNNGHLFGFLSIVNDKMVKDLKFYKSWIPSKYSSRLASVIDIKLKEGNKEEHKQSLTLGLINANVSLEGPIKESKSSYIIGFRAAYTSLLSLLTYSSTADNRISYNVIDLNTKFSFNLTDKSKLNVSFTMVRKEMI